MLLLVPAEELLTSSEQHASARAAFWSEWSAGKPMLVRGVAGKLPWDPAVRSCPFLSCD